MPELVGIILPTKPILEIVIRGSAGFLILVLLLRVIPKRNAGHISPNDMLILIIIGGMGADAIMGGSYSLGDIFMMVALVLGWGYLLDAVEYRFPALRGVLRDDATRLIENGRLLKRNMRRELVTEEELMAVLRRGGIEDLTLVRLATLEADGEISLVRSKDPS